MGRPLLEVPKSRIKGYLNRIKGVLTRNRKNGYLDYIKINSSFSSKNTIKRMESKPRVVEIPNKGMTSGIYKVLV